MLELFNFLLLFFFLLSKLLDTLHALLPDLLQFFVALFIFFLSLPVSLPQSNAFLLFLRLQSFLHFSPLLVFLFLQSFYVCFRLESSSC